jgi:hypothetical protein
MSRVVGKITPDQDTPICLQSHTVYTEYSKEVRPRIKSVIDTAISVKPPYCSSRFSRQDSEKTPDNDLSVWLDYYCIDGAARSRIKGVWDLTGCTQGNSDYQEC